MKKKIAISIVLVILVLCGIFFIVNTYLTGDMISEDINKYKELTKSKNVLPKLENLGIYNDIEFK